MYNDIVIYRMIYYKEKWHISLILKSKIAEEPLRTHIQF